MARLRNELARWRNAMASHLFASDINSRRPMPGGRRRRPVRPHAALAVLVLPLMAGRRIEDPLHNARRRAIYEAVLANPGVHLRELQRLTGLRWASLQYHTTVLRGDGLLTAIRAGRRTVFAAREQKLSAEQIKGLQMLRGTRARSVAEALLRAEKPLAQRDLAGHSRVNPRLVNRYLSSMADLGLVQVSRSRPRRYAAAPRLAELLARIEDHRGGGRR